ncbi:hypothetical protein AXG55_07370 [Silvanigrella aquatica]|uniref:Uncharacterized protein n=1 Tax=Silvanigrella aquatica TaxID=1915309 RepID=A0A1L4D0L8_9BACT|nr:hypothetical protein AXG55_07370 [Silvanigrella aquatica]
MGCSSSSSKYPLTDHCNGSKFYNPVESSEHGFLDVVKLMFAFSFENWPEKLENSINLDIK